MALLSDLYTFTTTRCVHFAFPWANSEWVHVDIGWRLGTSMTVSIGSANCVIFKRFHCLFEESWTSYSFIWYPNHYVNAFHIEFCSQIHQSSLATPQTNLYSNHQFLFTVFLPTMGAKRKTSNSDVRDLTPTVRPVLPDFHYTLPLPGSSTLSSVAILLGPPKFPPIGLEC